MNRNDIVRLAREAGITSELVFSGWGEHWIDIPVHLERFATLVAEHEREEMGKDFLDFYRMMVMLGDKESAITTEHCMSLIRMRSKRKPT
jgi:hypothetical protein